MQVSAPYADISVQISKTLSATEKRSNGIYFTPPNIVARHRDCIAKHMKSPKNLLEPSFGSGEYLRGFAGVAPRVVGVEMNAMIYEKVKDDDNTNHTTLICADFLAWETDERFDLIVGNPPFHVMAKQNMPAEYAPYYDGRPNIFVAFVLKSLSLLTEGGVLGFVLPANFKNCAYYDALRRLIYDQYKILDIMDCADGFLDTAQETICVTVKKPKGGRKQSNIAWAFQYAGRTIFGTKSAIKELRESYVGATSIGAMGLSVGVGKVVWNQHKERLTDDPSACRLIYSGDIRHGVLGMAAHKNPEKQHWIVVAEDGESGPKPEQGMVMVVNRGYGVGTYEMSHCVIDVPYPYAVENHLVCIRGAEGADKDQLAAQYKRITNSFNDPRTARFVQLYFGNSAINTAELRDMVPIY
jgi:adenine-specific DNA-methyltransferase